MGFEVLHNKDGTHDSLIITVHHATERGEETSHEDIWVVKHAKNAMLFIGVGAANERLADFCLFYGFLEDGHVGRGVISCGSTRRSPMTG